MFTNLNEDNNAYTNYYKELKLRNGVPSDYKGNIHHHHFRLKNDTLRDDSDFVECTYDEHIELHRLMYECYPCASTIRAYNITIGWYNSKDEPKSEEHKRKIGEAQKGKQHPHKGHPCSEDAKRKISDTLSGRKVDFTEEHRKHLSEALKGKPKSEEHIRNNSEAQHRKPVGMFDYNTDKLIKAFRGKREAERDLGKKIGVYETKPKNNRTGYYFKYLIGGIVKMKMRVLDISENNGLVDFEPIAKTYYGVILRLGYGNRHLDEQFLYNYRMAKEAGLKIGVYYYSYALDRDMATNEGQFTVEILKEYGIEPSDLSLGVWFDMEDADDYKARNGMPSNEEITAMCSNYIVELNRAGYWCGIYASLDWLENVIYTDQLADYVYYWVAQWDDDLDWDKNVFLWQYTATEYFEGKYFDCSFLMKH